MTQRSSSRKSRLAGPGAALFLLIIAAALLINYWQKNRSGNDAPYAWNIATATAAGQEEIRGDAISVWFSDPLVSKKSGGPEGNLVAAMNGAQKSIDVAIYNLSLDSVGRALINAKSRGVVVRLVMESESMDKQVPQSLLDAKIPIVGDQMEGLMHNKFAVIDGQEVWTGSMNYTSASSYTDFNNLVRLRSAELASDYQAAFDEMFEKHRFGPNKAPSAPDPAVLVGSAPVSVYFSPNGGASAGVVAELKKARKSILFLAYSFTSDPFAQAIKERAAAGVTVRGVFDADQVNSNTGGEYEAFKKAGYDVKVDGIPGLMHDKVIIIDNQVVITGSYNFSSNAERTNDENLVIIHDNALANQYLAHFEQVYGNAR